MAYSVQMQWVNCDHTACKVTPHPNYQTSYRYNRMWSFTSGYDLEEYYTGDGLSHFTVFHI